MLNESKPISIDAVGAAKPSGVKLSAAIAAASTSDASGPETPAARENGTRENGAGPPPIPIAAKAAATDPTGTSKAGVANSPGAVAAARGTTPPEPSGAGAGGKGQLGGTESDTGTVALIGAVPASATVPGRQPPERAVPERVAPEVEADSRETTGRESNGRTATGRPAVGNGEAGGGGGDEDGHATARESEGSPPSPGAGRRAAKRRPAGVVPQGRAANDDLPSIGGLIFALHQKPSQRPFTIAAIASAVWVPLALLLGAATLAPDWSAAKGIWDFLARPAVLAIAGTTLIPVAVFWFLAQLVWRAQELRLMSSAMSEVAIRLAEPDRMAEQSIASLGQAVRRQVSFMNEGVTRALGRANELEALVHNEVAALERSYRENEHKIRSLVQELAGERHSLVNTSDRVSDTLRSLSVEVPALIEKLGQQQHRLSGLIESAGQNLIQLEGAVAQSSDRLESTLDSRTHRLQTVLDDYSAAVGAALGERTEQLQEVLVQFNEVLDADMGHHAESMRGMLEHRSGEIRELLVTEVGRLEMSLDRHGDQIGDVFDAQLGRLAENVERESHRVQQLVGSEADRMEITLSGEASRIETAIGSGVRRLETTLADEAGRIETAIGSGVRRLETTLADEAGRIETALGSGVQRLETSANSVVARLTDELEGGVAKLDRSYDDGVARLAEALGSHTDRLEGIVGERADQMRGVLDQYTTALDSALEHRTQQIETAFSEHGRSLDGLLAARASGLDQQLLARTRALDEAFAERLRTLDESILRSTTTIDQSVGAKAAALTAALETHARQLTEALGRQSRDLDQSVVRSLADVHRTSEKITLHSVKAIESITGQADMLRNVSENLLQQISGVTNRFEGQGQTIMKAANALEAANYRIDSMLQTRTTELTNTLETLSGKAGEFARVLAGYSTAVEGLLEETEAKARALTRQLTQGAQSSSEAALAELERLKSVTDTETDRALEELKTRVSQVSREVSEHMGSLSSRFADTSEEMRRRAQKAAGEIAEEQRRIHQQLEALPAATRESAEAMRSALGEQLPALDQLSAFPMREQRRRDVSPPLAAPSSAHASASNYVAPPNYAASPDNAPTPVPTPAAGRPAQALPAPPMGGTTSLTAAFASEAQAPRGDNDRPTPSMSALAESGAQHLSSRSPAGHAASNAGHPTGYASPAPAPAATRAAAGAAPFAGNGTASGHGAGIGNGYGNGRTNGSGDSRDGWSLGDLLARASREDPEPTTAAPVPVPLTPIAARPTPVPDSDGNRAGTHPFDIETIARALDAATASALWSRLRAGQRGIMVRSIYTPAGRRVFDEVSRRYRSEHDMRAMVDRYVAEFERLMQDVDRKDPSGRLLHGYLASDSGRVYLFLAHAAGRLG